ncbi:fumarylacetoacetate hydrolase family protein [Jiangella gansuensis]|uniref:fumarylacetoacetate hydrolase family protein n=1 Tax=Jiangella gansuensis TaxID=281473 RepID=UPI00047CA6FD|nr:fumarylacetoacetate hydrolase family protein [Jiangella gansuensis]
MTYTRSGQTYHGRVQGVGADATVVELGAGDLLSVLEGGGLDAVSSARGPEYPLAGVTIGAPLRRPPKLLAVAANYADHIREGGGEPMSPERATPRLFLKPSTAIIGPTDPLALPSMSTEVDWEVELAVVIGQRCRNIPEERALDVVAGYMTANDISARSVDFHVDRSPEHVRPFFDWLVGKWPDGFAPLGPYLVSADEVPDPHALELYLDVNGEVRQQGSTADMIFGVAQLIAFTSSFMTLEPGDVIETGTPAGVGAASATYLEPGDVMTARVGDLGVLRTPIVATPA